MAEALRLAIASAADVEQVSRAARTFADQLNFSREDAEVLVLAVRELATNLVRYAHAGTLTLETASASIDTTTLGIQVTSSDGGPGILDIERAMQDGFSTGGGLGSGLPGARRLMDTFEILSSPEGTHIVACKWPAHRS